MSAAAVLGASRQHSEQIGGGCITKDSYFSWCPDFRTVRSVRITGRIVTGDYKSEVWLWAWWDMEFVSIFLLVTQVF